MTRFEVVDIVVDIDDGDDDGDGNENNDDQFESNGNGNGKTSSNYIPTGLMIDLMDDDDDDEPEIVEKPTPKRPTASSPFSRSFPTQQASSVSSAPASTSTSTSTSTSNLVGNGRKRRRQQQGQKYHKDQQQKRSSSSLVLMPSGPSKVRIRSGGEDKATHNPTTKAIPRDTNRDIVIDGDDDDDDVVELLERPQLPSPASSKVSPAFDTKAKTKNKRKGIIKNKIAVLNRGEGNTRDTEIIIDDDGDDDDIELLERQQLPSPASSKISPPAFETRGKGINNKHMPSSSPSEVRRRSGGKHIDTSTQHHITDATVSDGGVKKLASKKRLLPKLSIGNSSAATASAAAAAASKVGTKTTTTTTQKQHLLQKRSGADSVSSNRDRGPSVVRRRPGGEDIATKNNNTNATGTGDSDVVIDADADNDNDNDDAELLERPQLPSPTSSKVPSPTPETKPNKNHKGNRGKEEDDDDVEVLDSLPIKTKTKTAPSKPMQPLPSISNQNRTVHRQHKNPLYPSMRPPPSMSNHNHTVHRQHKNPPPPPSPSVMRPPPSMSNCSEHEQRKTSRTKITSIAPPPMSMSSRNDHRQQNDTAPQNHKKKRLLPKLPIGTSSAAAAVTAASSKVGTATTSTISSTAAMVAVAVTTSSTSPLGSSLEKKTIPSLSSLGGQGSGGSSSGGGGGVLLIGCNSKKSGISLSHGEQPLNSNQSNFENGFGISGGFASCSDEVSEGSGITSKKRRLDDEKADLDMREWLMNSWLENGPVAPSKQELMELTTPRQRDSLQTFYKRFNELRQFIAIFGDANVPQQFPENHSLGIWVNKMRMERKKWDTGSERTSLTERKIELLESIDFIWAQNHKGEIGWERRFQEICEFKRKQGHCNIPTKSAENRALGRWVSTQRTMYKNYMKGFVGKSLTREEQERRITLLRKEGFLFSMNCNGQNPDGGGKGDSKGLERQQLTVSPPTFETKAKNHHKWKRINKKMTVLNRGEEKKDDDEIEVNKSLPSKTQQVWLSPSMSNRTVHLQHKNPPPPLLSTAIPPLPTLGDRSDHRQHKNPRPRPPPPLLSTQMRPLPTLGHCSDHRQHKEIRTKAAVALPLPSKLTCPSPSKSRSSDHQQHNNSDTSVNSIKKKSPGILLVGTSAADGPEKRVSNTSSRSNHRQQNDTGTSVNSNEKPIAKIRIKECAAKPFSINHDEGDIGQEDNDSSGSKPDLMKRAEMIDRNHADSSDDGSKSEEHEMTGRQTKDVDDDSSVENESDKKVGLIGNDGVARENSSNVSSHDNTLVIEIPDGDTSDEDTDTQANEGALVTTTSSLQEGLRMSRDRQLAVYLNTKWRGENHSDGNANLSLENNLPPQDPLKSPIGEVIELMDESDSDSEADVNNTEKNHPAPLQKQRKTDGQGADSISPNATSLRDRGMAEEDEVPTADASTNGQQATVEANGKDGRTYRNYKDTKASTNKMVTRLTRRKVHEASNNEKKQVRKKRNTKYARPSSQSLDDESSSASSVWTDSFHNSSRTRNRTLAMQLRGSKNVISSPSASDNNSNSKSQYAQSITATKNSSFDFTGKVISTTNSMRRRSIAGRASRRIAVASEEDGTNDTQSIHHCRETLPSPSPSNSLDAFVLQPKAPPPMKNIGTVKKNVTEIYQRMLSGHQKANRSILEKALSQQNTYKRQSSASTRTCSPRIKSGTKRRLKYMEGNERRSISSDGHTAIVNSSLTVLSTVDDDKVKEDTERNNLEIKARRLSVMPYHLKILRKQFTSILDALPVDHRYHPEVHEHVSKLLYSPENKTEKLEVPSRFEVSRTDDILPPEATPKLKDPDENNSDYVSVMKGFRDFCAQCKTFDCQFHITSYPDAATQACVAIQYDKNALIRQKRETFRLNKNDPFSFLIPTADNTMVLVNGGASVRFNNPTSVDVIGSNKSTDKWIDKSTYNFSSEDMLCPFCKFCCRGKDKLSKHLSRYHGDTFYCREVGSKITALVRTGGNETIVPEQQYFHSKSLIPIESGHYDRDSDEESDYSWYHDYRRDLMEDITDVSEKEKRILSMWNRFLGCSAVVIADKDVPPKCFYFIQEHAMDLGELEWELYQLLITFWERHLLSVIHVEKLMHLFHVKQDSKTPQQENTFLSPRKKVLYSRLYIIFESFGEDMLPKLCAALRRNDVGPNDVVTTPMLSKHMQPKWTKKRCITTAMRRRAKDISRPFFFPCSHAGKCDEANGCTCIENQNLCTKHCVWGEYGENFFPGCSCTGDCTSSKACLCRSADRECDPDVCRCSASTDGDRRTCGCANMDVSLRKRADLLIGQSQIKGGGLGLYTKDGLAKGDYIDEYIGELIKREYQLGRSEEYYFDHSDDYITDATHQGNKTRYVNHSLTPNIEARHRFVNGEKRIAFYAKHDIPAQTELYYSYGKSYNNIWRSKGLPQLCVDSDDGGYQESEI